MSCAGICNCWSTQWAARAAIRLSRVPWIRSMEVAEIASHHPYPTSPISERRKRQQRATNGTTGTIDRTVTAVIRPICCAAICPPD
jgi:hypothetical protein